MGIHTQSYANEITWQIDGGTTFGPYADNVHRFETLCLSTDDEHTFFYIDSYGDGWHGGFWELCVGDCIDSNRIAGGANDGLV